MVGRLLGYGKRLWRPESPLLPLLAELGPTASLKWRLGGECWFLNGLSASGCGWVNPWQPGDASSRWKPASNNDLRMRPERRGASAQSHHCRTPKERSAGCNRVWRTNQRVRQPVRGCDLSSER